MKRDPAAGAASDEARRPEPVTGATSDRVKHVVGVADMKISATPGELIVTHALGSCLGIALHDPVAKVGGILHVPLPLSSMAPEKAKANPYMFVDTGLPKFFREAYAAGAAKERLVVKVAGGANLNSGRSDRFAIGKRNRVVLRKLFWKSVKERPFAYVMTMVRRLPLALATPFTFGYQNPWKTQYFSEAREAGQDRYQVVRQRPLYVLAAYWDRLAMGGLTFVSLLSALFMLIKERRSFGLLLLLFSPHLYSIASHIVTHLEPRFLLPSMFSVLIGLAYVISRGWRDRFAACRESQLEG